MIRAALPHELPRLLDLSLDSGLFTSEQLELLRDTLAPALVPGRADAPFCLARFAPDSACLGLVYCEPERMTDAVWNLRLIAVHSAARRQGLGRELLAALASTLLARSARLLLADTSGTPDFAPVREFYRRAGFAEECRLRDFFAPGVDKLTFVLPLTPPPPR